MLGFPNNQKTNFIFKHDSGELSLLGAPQTVMQIDI